MSVFSKETDPSNVQKNYTVKYRILIFQENDSYFRLGQLCRNRGKEQKSVIFLHTVHLEGKHCLAF